VSAKAAAKKQNAAKEREQLLAASRKKQSVPDPFSPENIRKLGIRLGLPLIAGWVVVFFLDHWVWKVIMGVITLAIAGVTFWLFRYAQKSKKVVEILKGADTPEGRKQALEKLDSDFKKGDAAAVFAKAQLEMQEDPRKALATLEQINLSKVMAHVADEARAQRAMIHLILGETDEARALVDPIDLSRHQEAKSRATLTTIIAEAWARSGQAKRAVELLEKIDLSDATYEDLKPQVLRSRAFAYAFANNSKAMKKALHDLKALNVQYLMGFITKKKNPMGVAPRGVHPLLEKEAFDMVMKSGVVQRKMEVRRM
jgi:hypothetical protein